MEMATNVRDFLVGMEETVAPEMEALLTVLQDLHEQYLLMQNDFNAQVSDLALSMSPEARVVAHQLRLRMYQDWRARLMERIFNTEVASPVGSPLSSNTKEAASQQHECEDEICVCALRKRLGMYKKVIDEFLVASPTIKSTLSTGSASPDCGEKHVFDASDSNEFSDDGLADQCFLFPEFLRFSPVA